MLIHGGPHSYAGDFREGFAVVRGMDGLCRHINLEGQYIYDYSFLDLDVFHKGFARARDDRGWYHINTDGNDISSGKDMQKSNHSTMVKPMFEQLQENI